MKLGNKTCSRCDRPAVGWIFEEDDTDELTLICQTHLLELIAEHDPELAEILSEANE